VQKAFTRPAPKSAGAQMRYLVKQLKGYQARCPDAADLPAHRREVREGPDQKAPPGPRGPAGARGEEAVAAADPRRVKERAATTGGIVIDTRARIGYTAPIGTTDDARARGLRCRAPRRAISYAFPIRAEPMPPRR
jgi:hypothetical protein